MKESSNPRRSPMPQDTRGKENSAMMPRVEKAFALFMRQQKYAPGKPFASKKQLIELLSGNDEVPLSDSTIRRVVQVMRDYWRLPVDYIPERAGYGFTEAVAGFPLDVISEEQVYYLIQSVQMLGVHKHSEVFAEIRRAVKKACLGVTMALGVEFEDIEQALSFHVVGFDAPAPVDPKLFKAAVRAILKKQEVTLEHRSVKRRGEVSIKTIEPLHLAMINHALYLFHWDDSAEVKPGETEEDAKIRKFALTRISEPKPTRRKCKPRKFDVNKRVKRGMGVYDEVATEPVELLFTPKIAPFILEREWHEEQIRTENADGSVRLMLPVAHTPEVEAFVLRWAGNVEVVRSASLRRSICEMGKALVAANS